MFVKVLAFEGWDWRMLSSCIVTHACMKAFERFCNWFMTNDPPEPLNTTLSKVCVRAVNVKSDIYFNKIPQTACTHTYHSEPINMQVFTSKGRYRMSQAGLRAIQRMNKVAASDEQAARNAIELTSGFQKVRRRKHTVEGRPLYGLVGFIEWVIFAAVVLAWYVAQFFATGVLRQQVRVWWLVFSASYLGLHLIHWVLTLRDGYMVSLTHMLNMPSVFKASSPRPDATCWLSAPMHMKWKLLATNAVFWVMVFSMKMPFDYFVIAKPVVEPLKIVVHRNWLECQGKW